jgi:hypothetical protein
MGWRWAVLAITIGLIVGSSPGALAVEDGFYVAVGLGGATVSGVDGVRFDTRGACAEEDGGPFLWAQADDEGGLRCVYARDDPAVGLTSAPEDIHRALATTRFGSGLAGQLRLGWNVRGHVSFELVAAAHGKPSGAAGALHVGAQIRWHPAELAIDHDERAWDLSLFYGTGYSLGTYHPAERLQREVQPDDPRGLQGLRGVAPRRRARDPLPAHPARRAGTRRALHPAALSELEHRPRGTDPLAAAADAADCGAGADHRAGLSHRPHQGAQRPAGVHRAPAAGPPGSRAARSCLGAAAGATRRCAGGRLARRGATAARPSGRTRATSRARAR